MGGQIPQPIPTSEIIAWCDISGVHSIRHRALLNDVVALLDREYLTVERGKYGRHRSTEHSDSDHRGIGGN